MYDTVLVPLDGTPLAAQALAHAASLVRRGGGDLHLVTVRIEGPTTLPEAPRPPELENVEADYLEAMATELTDAGVSSVSHRVLSGSEVAETIEAYRAKVGADLTVMATHGRGPVQRAWMGSVADRFIRATAAATWLVRPGEEDEDAPADVDLAGETRVERVLVPLDGSDVSEEALAPALEVCRRYGAACSLVRIVASVADVERLWLANPFEVEGSQLEAARNAAKEHLDGVAQRVRSEGMSVEGTAVLAPHVARGILEHAEEVGADLIVMATHGRSGVARVLLGSVADKVIRGADGPVLLVRPDHG